MAMAIGLIGAGVQAMGAIQGGKAAKAEANYKAAVARNNQIIAKQNADYEIDRGRAEADTQNLETRAVLGAQRTAQAASGFDMNYGTPVRVRETAAALGALDAETIRNNSLRKANDYLAQASNFGAEAQLQVMSGKNAQQAGYLKAFGSLIGGAQGVADRWATMNSKGLLT